MSTRAPRKYKLNNNTQCKCYYYYIHNTPPLHITPYNYHTHSPPFVYIARMHAEYSMVVIYAPVRGYALLYNFFFFLVGKDLICATGYACVKAMVVDRNISLSNIIDRTGGTTCSHYFIPLSLYLYFPYK